MAPRTIFVMRHAEKPSDAADPNLSPAGRARAQALVAWVPTALGTPDHIFASAPSKHSNRPVETVTPLADSLGHKKIHQDYADAQFAELAAHLLTDGKYDGSVVLVCWHHGEVPELMRHLGAPKGRYADPWPAEVFNVVYGLDYASGAPTVTLHAEPF